MAQGCGDRQDAGEQPDDRSGCRQAWPEALRSAGRLQVVRSVACWTARLAFGGEESAGASFVRLDGSVWTTDKDGIIPALLAAEITARMGRDPGEIYRDLTREFGEPCYDRVQAPATPEQKELLAKLSPQQVKITELAGEKIQTVLTHAPGNGAPDRRVESHSRERLVRGPAVRHREHLQDLCGELPGSGSSAPHHRGSPGHRQQGFDDGNAGREVPGQDEGEGNTMIADKPSRRVFPIQERSRPKAETPVPDVALCPTDGIAS